MIEKILDIISQIGLFLLIWATSYIFIKMTITMYEDNKNTKRKQEASIIYNRKKREFDYHNNPEAWKKWKYMNDKICDIVEEGSYY